MAKKYIILDTETTGLHVKEGHRIIEIGAVLLNDRKKSEDHFHTYLNPMRLIDDEATQVHGITNEDLNDKPLFEDIAEEFLEFVDGATLVIHNAEFDVGFLNHELKLLQQQKPLLEEFSTVVDTLVMARKKHPGKRNSLDALCDRYAIDNSHRDKHGALLDAEILSEVYLVMTGGQESLLLDGDASDATDRHQRRRVHLEGELVLMQVDEEDMQAHEEYLERLQEQTDGHCIWIK